jgi:hypothetical protein
MSEPEERITAVATWQDAPNFTEAERAALALVEAVSPLPPGLPGPPRGPGSRAARRSGDRRQADDYLH